MHLAANNFNGFGERFRDADGVFSMPVAGKTGTTQNWADAWIVGYTPYYTTAIWFGFDRPGSSLGTGGTGAGLVGPFWGRYMRDIHQGLARRDFVRPATGIVYITVCSRSGKLVNPSCDEGTVTLPFMQGTQPTQFCDQHGAATWSTATAMGNIRTGTSMLDTTAALGALVMPTLPDLFLDDLPATPPPTGGGAQGAQQTIPEPTPWTLGNPLLDGGGFANPLLEPESPAETAPSPHEGTETAALEPEADLGGFIGAETEPEIEAEGHADAGIRELAQPVGNPFLD